jgi:hypothetical protein
MRTLLVASLLALGCADPAPAPPPDATLDDAPDAVTPDVSAMDAALDVARDVAREAARDATVATDVAPDAAVVDDVPIDPGMCGPLTRMCLCDCGGGATCQNACIARNDDCGFCVYTAATRCCPDESRVFDDCIDRNMCADEGCIAARCGAEQRRFEACFGVAQTSEESCRREMRGCLGSDYPMIRCVQP